ncbi:MAG: hypothetical protein CMB31_04925 [Euryarchaeota archaeon]|nr:hypothetical protein [Euryarchaeota archaeon]
MDPPPFKIFISYLIIWFAWLYAHDNLSKKQEIDYAIKLDDILYNNTSSNSFPFGPREFSDFNMV